MTKKTFLMAATLSCITLTNSFAQEAIKINENSSKGVYVRISGGYSFGTGKTSGGANGLMPGNNTSVSSNSNYQSRFGTVNTNESTNTTTRTNAAFSLDEGINTTLGIGYMLNKNIGIELSGGYLLGTNNTVENKTSTKSYRDVAVSSGNNNSTHAVTESSNMSSTTNSMKRTCFSLTPAVKLVAPVSEKLSMYSRIGVMIPISDKMVYEYKENKSQYYRNSVNNSMTSNSSSGNHESKTMEFSSFFKLGYSAGIGVNFALGKNINLFGEINGVSHSFEAKKSIITEWSKSSNTDGKTTNTNLLTGLDTRDKETEYLQKYVVDNKNTPAADKNSPKKDVTFSLPASSISITAGFAYKF